MEALRVLGIDVIGQRIGKDYFYSVVSKENKTVAEEFDKIAKYHLNDDVVSKTLGYLPTRS